MARKSRCPVHYSLTGCPYWINGKCTRKVVPELYRQHTDEVQRVVSHFIAKLKEWGFDIPSEKEAKKKLWGVMENLIRYGIPKKAGNVNENYTPPDKMIKIIDTINKSDNPMASLIYSVKHQNERLK